MHIKPSGSLVSSIDLHHPDSMTEYLEQLSQEPLQVNLLCAQWQVPYRQERKRLDLPVRQRAWCREVKLYNSLGTWIIARAVFPASTLRGRGRRYQTLGTTPLGKILFREQKLVRSEFLIWQLSSTDPYYRMAVEQGQIDRCQAEHSPQITCRQSSFAIPSGELLLTELLMPRLTQQWEKD